MSEIGMRLTRDGKNILAKGLLGKEIHFTRGALGAGEFEYQVESVFELVALRDERMTIPIESIKRTGDGTVSIVCHQTNAEVYEGFPAREHGIFAQDPDSGEEKLYAYVNRGEEYSFIPSNLGAVTKDIRFSYVTVIQDAENVSATLDLSFAYTAAVDFDEHVKAVHPHPNVPNHLLDISETDKIWATDNDDHLHQISVNNLKKLLRDDTGTESSQDRNNIIGATSELGLDANVFIFEDFKGESTVDELKIKVTSSAENGNLIGVERIEGLRTGGTYTISDGVNQEVIRIASVRRNVSGIHAVVKNRLSHSYNFDATYLYRTTTGGSRQKTKSWRPDENFHGIEANIARNIELQTNIDRSDDFEITGDGFLTADGFFVIGG